MNEPDYESILERGKDPMVYAELTKYVEDLENALRVCAVVRQSLETTNRLLIERLVYQPLAHSHLPQPGEALSSAQVRDLLKTCQHDRDGADAEVRRLTAELEEFQAENERLKAENANLSVDRAVKAEEIDQLRAALFQPRESEHG